MEAFFSIFHVGEMLLYDTPAPCQQPYSPGGTGSAKTHEGCTMHSHQNPINHLLGAPGAKGQLGMVRGGQGAPSPSNFLFFKSKTTSALPESASALPGDIAGDRAHFCARFRSRPPPGSPLRLPGKFQVTPWAASVRNAGVAHLF
jgi:hypothetical protein